MLNRDSKDAETRTAESESQLFQSRISNSNPFTLPYLYRSLDRKSHASTMGTNTSTTTAPPTSSTASPGSKKSSVSSVTNQEVASGVQGVNNNNATSRTSE